VVPQRTVADWLSENGKSSEFAKAPDSRQHFDVWNFASDGSDSSYCDPHAVADAMLGSGPDAV
jgi:hypothetical protein